MAGLEPTSFCLADLKKALTSIPSASRSSVTQFSVIASQLIKLIKSVSSLVFKKTRRELLKLQLYLMLKKRKRLLKNLKFLSFFFQKMSHSAKKCKRGDPLGFINIYSVAKYQKT